MATKKKHPQGINELATLTVQFAQGQQNIMPNISELWTKIEKLDPELLPYLKKDALGQSLKHPLLYDILYLPKRNAEFNYRLLQDLMREVQK